MAAFWFIECESLKEERTCGHFDMSQGFYLMMLQSKSYQDYRQQTVKHSERIVTSTKIQVGPVSSPFSAEFLEVRVLKAALINILY